MEEGRLISPAYRDEQRRMHASARYGDSGGKWWARVIDLLHEYDCASWLDYGCGNGKLTRNVLKRLQKEVQIVEYDPGITGKDDSPLQRFDLVTCIDVLEHIEPECLQAVLQHLYFFSDKVLFAVISTRPAGKVLSDGRNAHLIIEGVEWWRTQLILSRFNIVKAWAERPDEWCTLCRVV